MPTDCSPGPGIEHANYLTERIADLERENKQLKEALLDVLTQACYSEQSSDPRCKCGHPRSTHKESGCFNPEAWNCGCITFKDRSLYDTGALSAYRDGWELCVELGIAEREGELVGRRGFYRPNWKAFDTEEGNG
jgi:hypothetical protein